MLIIKDINWTPIKRRLRELDNSYTKVGFPENAQIKPPKKKIKGQKIATNMSEIATIAAFNEFGTKKATSKRSGGSSLNIPARPFMSTSLDENLVSLNQLKEKLYDKILAGIITPRQGLALLGEFMESKTKKKIRDIKNPPNSIVTIKKKKSSNPLIDTSQMLQSITHIEVMK